MKYIIFGFVWGLVGITNFGGMFAYWQKEFPRIAPKYYKQDLIISVFLGILGLLAFPAVLFGSRFYKHGFKFN